MRKEKPERQVPAPPGAADPTFSGATRRGPKQPGPSRDPFRRAATPTVAALASVYSQQVTIGTPPRLVLHSSPLGHFGPAAGSLAMRGLREKLAPFDLNEAEPGRALGHGPHVRIRPPPGRRASESDPSGVLRLAVT
jgi:hypothetical protein